VAGDPANYWTHHYVGGHLWSGIATDGDAYIPASKVPILADAVNNACDKLDGVEDGVLSDPRRCHFDPKKLLCAGADTTTCLTAPQVSAVEKLWAGVKTADGRLFEADMVVNCAGRWANDPVSDAGLHLPLAPTVGFLVFTPPVAARVGRVVRSPIIHARPDGAGRVVLHWNPTDAALAFDPRPSASMPEARDLVQRLCTLMPVIGPVEPEAARMAIRPIPGDGFSAVGPVPRVDGYYLAITHSAVTMSAFLGAAVADEVVHGRERAELADFRPARFFN